MRLRGPFLLAVGVLAATLASCGRFDNARRPAWRGQAEATCLARHLVAESDVVKPVPAIEGPGICGLDHPFRVYALAGGTVRLDTASILDCSMIPALDAWIHDVVQPDAAARFGEPVVQIDTMGTYNCRGINNQSGAGLSEHAFGNAIDVAGFVLASGRVLNVMRGWSGPDAQESAFLRDAHAGACATFTTVLGPGSNIFHYNHVHMDLAAHGNTSRGPRRYCKPVPDAQVPAPRLDALPDPPAIEEEMDVAQTPLPRPALTTGHEATFVASVPDASPMYRQADPADAEPAGPPAPVAGAAPVPLALVPMPRRRDASRALDVGPADASANPVPQDWDMTSFIQSRALR